MDVPAYELPVTPISTSPGDFETFSIPSIYTFASNKATLCPITKIELFEDNLGATPLTDPNIVLFNGNNPAITTFNFFSDNSYKISFWIKGSTEGRVYNDGAYAQVTLVVCGGETLSLSASAAVGPY